MSPVVNVTGVDAFTEETCKRNPSRISMIIGKDKDFTKHLFI
jgi:hypothetical protein